MPVFKGLSDFAEITDHLYLCGINSLDVTKIRLAGITHVINVTLDMPDTTAEGITCTRVAVDDMPEAPLSQYFDSCADRINTEKEGGGKTLVHCTAGASRSVAICIAYLMKYEHRTLRDAYKRVKLRRPIAHPNVGFFRQLIDYERLLFGSTSVTMVPSPVGEIPDLYLDQTKGMINLDFPSVGDVKADDAHSGGAKDSTKTDEKDAAKTEEHVQFYL